MMDNLLDRKEERKIGIFEYDWSMYSFVKDFVIKLAEAGYLVDIFHKTQMLAWNFTNSQQLRNYRNVRYFRFNISNTIGKRIVRKFKGF